MDLAGPSAARAGIGGCEPLTDSWKAEPGAARNQPGTRNRSESVFLKVDTKCARSVLFDALRGAWPGFSDAGGVWLGVGLALFFAWLQGSVFSGLPDRLLSASLALVASFLWGESTRREGGWWFAWSAVGTLFVPLFLCADELGVDLVGPRGCKVMGPVASLCFCTISAFALGFCGGARTTTRADRERELCQWLEGVQRIKP